MTLINRHWCFLEGTEGSAGKNSRLLRISNAPMRSLFLPYSGNMRVEPVLIWVIPPPEVKGGNWVLNKNRIGLSCACSGAEETKK